MARRFLIALLLFGAAAPLSAQEVSKSITFRRARVSVSTAPVKVLLEQWWPALESERGSHFLVQPTSTNTASLSAIRTLLGQWWGPLESWRGNHYLLQPNSTNTASLAALEDLLDQWHGAMEGWRGSNFLEDPDW